MEQTVNTFNKGLQTDTHPMVQGNDTLSDALNATFITMNGNEVILQNDMGNRKIDNAYLPTGYLPVGMKEYGGIIYVAAYNPITNKSQIGSFPSPERRIGEENSNLGGELNLVTYVEGLWNWDGKSFSRPSKEGINFLKEDTILIPLTKDTSLHAGDKFTVYSSDMWNLKNKISNFENIPSKQLPEKKKEESNSDYYKRVYGEELVKKEDESEEDFNIRLLEEVNKVKEIRESKKIFSPKNKLYTLQLGILNSLNEFVDITKSLERWDGSGKNEEKETGKIIKTSDKIISFDNNESDLYKFNSGYFIANNFDNSEGVYTKNDSRLIAERLKTAVNTYAYKLVGPLYLKATLNHILDFSYTIEGFQEGEDNGNLKAKITITATITYNCPDGIDFVKDNSNDTYCTLGEGPSENYKNLMWFSLFKKNKFGYTEHIDDKESVFTSGKSKYNESTNLYTITVSKNFNIVANRDSKNYDYYLCVPAIIGDDTYLEGLSTKGTLDISRLGSGDLELTGWRFYNDWNELSDDSKAIITYTFDTYPKPGHSFRNLKFKFTEIKSPNSVITDTIESVITDTIESVITDTIESVIPTKGNYEFNWKDYNLQPRTLYEVTILYDEHKGEESSSDESLELSGNSFFLTTKLFNDCYSVSSSDFVGDFRKFMDSYLWENNEEELNFNQLFKNKYLKINIYSEIDISLNQINTNTIESKLLSKESIDWAYLTNTNKFSISEEDSIKTSFNEKLYPKNIKIEGIVQLTMVTPEYSGKLKISEYIEIVDHNSSIDIDKDSLIEIEYSNNIFNIDITQKYISKASQLLLLITNPIESFSSIFNDSNTNYINNLSPIWASIRTYGDTGDHANVAKRIDFVVSEDPIFSNDSYENLRVDIFYKKNKSAETFYIKDKWGEFNDLFNSLYSNKYFICGYTISDRNNDKLRRIRVFTKDSKDTWALFCGSEIINPSDFNSINTLYLRNLIKNKIEKIDFYSTFRDSLWANFYYRNNSDYIYTKDFYIPFNINFKFNLTKASDPILSNLNLAIFSFSEELESSKEISKTLILLNNSFESSVRDIIDRQDLSLIVLENGRSVDSDGQSFLVNQIYDSSFKKLNLAMKFHKEGELKIPELKSSQLSISEASAYYNLTLNSGKYLCTSNFTGCPSIIKYG